MKNYINKLELAKKMEIQIQTLKTKTLKLKAKNSKLRPKTHIFFHITIDQKLKTQYKVHNKRQILHQLHIADILPSTQYT